jgi:hypothetical protein
MIYIYIYIYIYKGKKLTALLVGGGYRGGCREGVRGVVGFVAG